jgi:hypothetical protein
MIQDRDKSKIKFINTPYLHTTHLPRGGNRSYDKEVIKRAKKMKYVRGLEFPLDYYYPEVFFRPRPSIVPSPWETAGSGYFLRAKAELPGRKLISRFRHEKVGY